MTGPNRVLVRFYVGGTPSDAVASKLGSYYELDILPPCEDLFGHLVRGYVNVMIIKEVSLDAGWFNASYFNGKVATYDGTTLYISAEKYDQALQLLGQIMESHERFVRHRDNPVPFPGKQPDNE